ncbi:MAG: hypothetical protein F9K44_08090 [Hyphomicrobiaceae bacterium]|nr:MAG: hypothetical protein F9K44_08090 [Hyphomicrobiaceae bacterium]
MSKRLITLIAISIGVGLAPASGTSALAAPVATSVKPTPGWEETKTTRATKLTSGSRITHQGTKRTQTTRTYNCRQEPSGVYVCW